jgi:hypothetical protein
MKTILMTVLLACALFAGACSRSDKPEIVKSDAELKQEAAAKAAEAKKNVASLSIAAAPTAPQRSPTPSAAQP